MAFLPQIDLLRTTTAWILRQGKWKDAVASEEDPDVGLRTRGAWGGREGGGWRRKSINRDSSR